MEMVLPAAIGDANLTFSNVAENDHAAWDVGTTYVEEDLVIHDHAIWQSTDDDNLGNTPSVSSAWWAKVSATNRWKCFDGVQNDQTQNSGTVVMTVDLPSAADAVVVLNVDADTVRVAGGGYDQTESFSNKTEHIFTGVNASTGTNITVTVDAGGGTASIGEIVMGVTHVLGTCSEAEAGIVDYSNKDPDSFGNREIVERPYADTMEYVFWHDKSEARAVRKLIASARAMPCVYHGAPNKPEYGAMIYGLLDDFSHVMDVNHISYASLDIDGVV